MTDEGHLTGYRAIAEHIGTSVLAAKRHIIHNGLPVYIQPGTAPWAFIKELNNWKLRQKGERPKPRKCDRCHDSCRPVPVVSMVGRTLYLCLRCCNVLYVNRKKARKGLEEPNPLLITTLKRMSDGKSIVVKEARARRASVDSRLVDWLYKNQDGRCPYCNLDLDRYQVDHIIPIVRGGDNRDENLQLVCPECNMLKGGKHPDTFRKQLAEGKIKKTCKKLPDHLARRRKHKIILYGNLPESKEN